jgi:uncharacterized protein YhaN
LAVNHAFIFGLPVVSQHFGKALLGHGPEAAYVHQGKTGLFSPAGDKEAMAQDIRHILENQKQFSANARDYADTYLRVEQMAEGFAQAVAHARANRLS